MNLIIFSGESKHDSIERFTNLLNNLNLPFMAGDLINMGFNEMASVNKAVRRAICTLKTAGEKVDDHIKPVFVSDEGRISCDWRISSLGRKLILMNADPENPFIAKIQLELLAAYNKRF